MRRFSAMMMLVWSRLFFSSVITLASIVILSGCSSTQQTIVDRSLTALDIIAIVNAQADSIQTFSAYGNINIETPTMNQGAGLDLAVKKPDSVRIIVEGPFGITVAKALFTKQRFTAYNALNNMVYEGNPSQGISSMPMMSAFPPEVLVDALSGIRRFNTQSQEPDSFYITEKFYTIVITGEKSISTFKVDPNSMRISSVKTYRSSGELLLEESYAYRQLENGKWIPFTAKIVVPEKQITLDISLDEITINGAIGSMLISIPDDADRTTIN